MKLCFAILLIVASATPLLSDDREKATKQIRMMTALSRDDIVRSIISRTFSDAFKVPRAQLVTERKSLGMNYGALFLAHELALSGCNMQQISNEVRAHKTMLKISDACGANWKRIAADAKKMKNRIDDGIYKHFLHDKPDLLRDQADQYVVSTDRVPSDAEGTPAEVEEAKTEYMFWRNQAAPKNVGMADANDPAVHNYNQARDQIAVTHGNTNPSTAPVK